MIYNHFLAIKWQFWLRKEAKKRLLCLTHNNAEQKNQNTSVSINSSVPGWEPYSPNGLPFSDHGINGTTHTLVLKEIVQVSPLAGIDKWTSMPRGFRLYAISKPYYNYLVSLLCCDTSDDDIHSGMIDLGIAEPIKIYCNIAGGLGILGCYTSHFQSIDVIKELGPFSK